MCYTIIVKEDKEMPLQIENKFNIGDKVYFLDNNLNGFEKRELILIIVECIITAIQIDVEGEGDANIRYWLMPLGDGSKEIPQGGGYYEEQYITKNKGDVHQFVKDLTQSFLGEE